ncbi:hypothetical protein [Paraburkholderia youngii]|uniref:hypothetical protein n=1 Tax=Paraburkholderia youngii TaxID=2782701 RepID=UPI003D256A08
MNPAVFDFFKATGIEMVRWRGCKKNDQARVAQKNGAVCTSSGGGRQATRSRSHRKLLPHFINVAAVYQLLPAVIQTEIKDRSPRQGDKAL